MISTGDDLDALLAATWPAAQRVTTGPLVLRRSPGGGQRVQAASLDGNATVSDAALAAAERQMAAWGQPILFRLLPGQKAFDRQLDARGYARRDPTVLVAGPLEPALGIDVPRLTTFDVWPPLAVMAEIWQAGGIGPDRIAVMSRASGTHTGLFGRLGDRPAGAGFVAVAGKTAVVHALEIRAAARRAGLARRMMGHAARWAARQGAEEIAALVTEANVAARALYASLGMAETGRYHYRRREEAP